MDDLPCSKLRDLISTYGLAVCDDHRRCEGLLRDVCGSYKLEIHVLVNALKARTVVDLLASRGVPAETCYARLTARLRDEQGMAEAAAWWAVSAWAFALGLSPALPSAGLANGSHTSGIVVGTTAGALPSSADTVNDREIAPSIADFESLVIDALSALPPRHQPLRDQLTVLIEDFPGPDIVARIRAVSAFDILGFRGGGASGSWDRPATGYTVRLFRRPILDYWAEHREPLGATIKRTLVRELIQVSHLVGEDFGSLKSNNTMRLARLVAPSLQDITRWSRDTVNQLMRMHPTSIEGLHIAVDNFPAASLLDRAGAASDFDLLGNFEGAPVTQRAVAATPNIIRLFRRPLLNDWASRNEPLHSIISKVVERQLGIYLGLAAAN
jgi:predicted Zn-dependent protease with MMP-like domain